MQKDKKDLRDKRDKKGQRDKKGLRDKRDKEDKNATTAERKAIYRGTALVAESIGRENPGKIQVNVTSAMRLDISQEIAKVKRVLYR